MSEKPLRCEPKAASASCAWKWLPSAVVILVLLGVHAWVHHCSSVHHAPTFSVIPSGGPGDMVVSPCGDGLDCGYINVPKDYFNVSAGVAHIAFARRKSLQQPSKGSIMFNPGGPGGSGVNMVLRSGPGLRRVTVGDGWDIVGFDPRGIGLTRPQTKCLPDSFVHQFLYANTVFEQGYTVPNPENISDPLNRISLTSQARQFLAIKEAQVQLCDENMDAEDLKYMGTATVVRDMSFMTEVLDGKGAKVNYNGGSYGSILGAYLVNMIPHLVGYSTIDGVVDPIQWANEPSHRWHKNWTSSAEKTYQWFLRDCSEAGPDLCALAKSAGEGPSAIEGRIEAFINGLVERPLSGTYNGRPGYVTSGGARSVLFQSLHYPRTQPHVARSFASAMDAKNATLLLSLLFTPANSPPGHSGGTDLSRLAVTCADSPWKPIPTAEDIADELLAGLQGTSKHFGASPIFTEPDGGCEFWPTRGRAPERFTGPWNASLDYPLLIISNTADPLTPIASGLRVNKQMPNSSTMIIQNGPGHCSTPLPSLCAIKASLAYWAGHPPKNGTWCEIDTKAFPNATNHLHHLSVEDQELLQTAIDMGKVMEELRRH